MVDATGGEVCGSKAYYYCKKVWRSDPLCTSYEFQSARYGFAVR